MGRTSGRYFTAGEDPVVPDDEDLHLPDEDGPSYGITDYSSGKPS